MIKRRRNVFWLLLGTLLLLVGGATYFVLTDGRARYDNLDMVKEASNLTIVLPETLPRGSSITYHPTYDTISQTIITRISVSGHGVTLSQQKRPETDLKQVDAADTFLVDAGSVYILKGEGGRLQAIVETVDSWVMVNADANIGNSVFKALLESLAAI